MIDISHKTVYQLEAGLYWVEVPDISKESYYLSINKQNGKLKIFQILIYGHVIPVSLKEAKSYKISKFSKVGKLLRSGNIIWIYDSNPEPNPESKILIETWSDEVDRKLSDVDERLRSLEKYFNEKV